jgi:hypothetical protein
MLKFNKGIIIRASNSHGDSYKDFSLLGYNTLQSVEKSANVSKEHVASIFRVEE